MLLDFERNSRDDTYVSFRFPLSLVSLMLMIGT